MESTPLDALFDLSPQALREPWRAFASIRAGGRPVAYSEAAGAYVVTGYAECVEALLQPEVFSSGNMRGKLATELEDRVRRLAAEAPDMRDLVERGYGRMGHVRALATADPPNHTRQRALVGPAFTPRRIATFEPLVRSTAHALLAGIGDRAEVDFVTGFAIPLPVRVLAVVLGVETSDIPRYQTWSVEILRMVGRLSVSDGELAEIVEHRKAFDRYFAEVIADRGAHPRDDFMTDFVRGAGGGEVPLGLDEMLQVLEQFMIAGHETTAKALSSAMLLMLESQGLEDRLRAAPDLMDGFVEEVLRLESPATGPFRVTTREVELGGLAIPAGSAVILGYAGANRDPAVFDRPESLDPARSGRPHLAFGLGPHFCIGHALARQEMRVGLGVLLERSGGFRLAGGLRGRQDLEYLPSFALHGLKALPIELHARHPPDAGNQWNPAPASIS